MVNSGVCLARISQSKGKESRREKEGSRNRANFLDFLIDCDVLGDGCHDRGTRRRRCD